MFDDLMEFICYLARDTPPGVWVASTDMLLKTTGSPGEWVGLREREGRQDFSCDWKRFASIYLSENH